MPYTINYFSERMAKIEQLYVYDNGHIEQFQVFSEKDEMNEMNVFQSIIDEYSDYDIIIKNDRTRLSFLLFTNVRTESIRNIYYILTEFAKNPFTFKLTDKNFDIFIGSYNEIIEYYNDIFGYCKT